MIHEGINKKSSEEDYFFIANQTKNLKKSLYAKVLVLKLISIFLVFYLIYLPFYLNFAFLPIPNFSLSINNFTFDSTLILLNIMPVLYIFVSFFILKGNFLLNNINSILLLSSFILMIIFETNNLFWPIKLILIFFQFRLIKLIEKFEMSYQNYKSYQDSYKELIRVNILLDTILRKYFFISFLLIILCYSLLLLFQFITIDVGLNIAIVWSIVILPMIFISLFKSQGIFKTFSRNKKAKY